MMHHNYEQFMGMSWIGFILWILFLVGIFAIIWKIIDNRKNDETPLDILKKRFASGEITKEEYEEQKRILKDS